MKELENEYIVSNQKFPIGSKVCLTIPAYELRGLGINRIRIVPEERIYVTVGGKCWAYCIPFDKSTADLVGSASDFEENE